MLKLERIAQGPSLELDDLTLKFYEKVIPHILRPLIVLNSIKPVLVHSNLWYCNYCTDTIIGKSIVFDTGAFWAYNECQYYSYSQDK
jgi:protein-ribulosamine 3-kinase